MASKQNFSLCNTIKLNSGILMPRIHLGVYMTSGNETTTAVISALRAGYRAIDSAEWYANEHEVGSAILSFLSSPQNTSSLTRADIWFTTKLKTNISYEATRKSIKKSIERSGLGYLDGYLLHSPYGGREKRAECWRAVNDAVREGEVRVAGVSNFGVRHLEQLPSPTPQINQIELHPFNTQAAISSYCHSHNITIQAYAPLARALRFKHPVILELSRKYDCTPAQLMIRWSLQKGYVPLPKSVSEERIRSNAEVGGFVIEQEDLERLESCDEGLVTDWDPTDAD